MKAWKLIKPLEYKQFSNSEQNIDNGNFIDCPPIDSTTPELIKFKMVKCNLSVVDIDYYHDKSASPNLPITPARSAVALVSESYDSSFEIGRRVFLSPYHADEKGNIITRSHTIDGYLSDYTVVNSKDAYPIPEGMTDSEVLFVEDVAVAVASISKLNISKGDYIALQGASYHNCIIAQLAIYYQAIPIIIDNDDDRLAIAQNLGVYYTIDTRIENAHRKTIEITSGKMIDSLVIDVDSFSTIDNVLPLVKRGGIVCLHGYKKINIKLKCNLDIILLNALTVVSIDNGYSDIMSAINLIANKVIKFDNLIGSETPFNNLMQIINFISDKHNPLKHIITFS